MNDDIRWHQRLNNFTKALEQLRRFVKKESLNELEEQGLIQAFEYTFELAWNVLKDFLTYQGNDSIYGSRDAIREAFNKQLIEDGEGWMEMFKDRNRTTHSYNKETADQIRDAIMSRYVFLFNTLHGKMIRLRDGK